MSELRTLQSLIDTLSEHGDRQAVMALHKEDAVRWSYRELADNVRRLACGLIEAGVGRGDHIALLADNRPEWIAACLATIGAGVMVVPLDVQLGDGELSYALDDSSAGFIFTTSDQTERLEHLDVEATPKLILLDVDEDDERSWRRLLTERDAELPRPEPDDPAALFYTSGTTGTTKGVPVSHANLAFQLDTLLEADLVSEEDRILLPLPLHHVYPFVMGMLTPLTIGLAIVMPQSLTGPQLVRALNEGEVSLVVGVPQLYEALYSGIEERARSGGRIAATLFETGVRLSTRLRRRLGLRIGRIAMRPLHKRFGPRVRVLASGGSALDPDLAWKLEGLGWQIAIGYGLTETSPLLTLNPPGGSKPGSAGRSVPGVELCIDPSAVPDEDSEQHEHRTVEPRKEGEIFARGPGVFAGYRNMPEETEEVFTEDGWFRTKDLGYFDEDGYLYVTGRASTLIVTESGENVQPEDVEETYLENPVIREIGVLQKDGRLVAVIVPEVSEIRQRGDGELGESVREAVEEGSKRLPSYQRLSDYAVTRQSLERTRLGELRRHLLEDRYDQAKEEEESSDSAAAGPISLEEMSEQDHALLDNPVAKRVWDWLADRYPDQRLTPDTSPQLDLGVDSMEWVNLSMEIGQSAGVELEEEAIERIDTVRDLLQEVAEQAEADEEAASGASPLEQPEEVLDDQQKRWLEPLGPVMSAIAQGLFVLDRMIMRGLFRLQVKGLEHLPEEGPFVLTPNHVSYLDPFAIAAALGYRRLRRTYWAGWKGAAFGNPLTRMVSRLAQAVPIDPDRAGVSSLAFGATVLKREKNLVWFPEGERSPTGKLQPFKPGIGVLLNHFRVPVVPVFIHGTYEAMPRGKFLRRLERITLVLGRPLDVDELERYGEGEEPQDRLTQALYNRMMELGDR